MGSTVSNLVSDAAEPYAGWPRGAVECLNTPHMTEVSTKQYAAGTEAVPGQIDPMRQWMTWPCRIAECNTLHINMRADEAYSGGALLNKPIRVLLLSEATVPRILECLLHLATTPPRHILHTHLFFYLLVGTYNITDIRYVPEGFLLACWRWMQRLCREALTPALDGVEIPGGHVFLFDACNKLREPHSAAMLRLNKYQSQLLTAPDTTD